MKKPTIPKLRKSTEKDTQKLILDYLIAKRIFHYRNNSGAFKREDGHFYRFGALGSPDIICVLKGQYVGIEVKDVRGVQSDNQRKFEQELVIAGGKYILAKSLEDVVQSL